MVLIQQMIVFFLLMVAGVICRKCRILDDASAKAVSGIVVNIANPALILSSGMGVEDKISGNDFVITAVTAAIYFSAAILIGEVVARLIRAEKDERGAYSAMFVFSNMTFMGFPLMMAISGPRPLLYGTVFIFLFNFLIYTYGIWSIKGGSSGRDKESRSGIRTSVLLKNIFNVGVIAAAIALILYFSGAKVPYPIVSTAETLGSMTGPLSMIVIGYSLAGMKIKELFGDVRLLIFSAIRLIAVPVLGMFIVKALITDEYIRIVCFVVFSAPAASMTSMLAQHYNGNISTTSRGVALTTLLSVATIPLVGLITGIF